MSGSKSFFSAQWWTASGDAARERIANALEKTGDMLTEKATAHVAQQRQKEKSDVTTATAEDSSSSSQPQKHQQQQKQEQQQQQQQQRSKQQHHGIHVEKAFASLQMGWGSVVETAVNAVHQAKDVVEKEQSRLFHPDKPYKRDVSLPLDVIALRDAEVVYVTDRIITMGHPALASQSDQTVTANRKLAAVGHLLQSRHANKFMIWNLSEVEYDYSILDDQVLTFQFPGSPSPPLGLLLKLLISMESWLKADPSNVAVVHCLTGRGRTSTVLAAFLCWTGEAGFDSLPDALQYIALSKRCSVESLTIPSQRRYASYFCNMLDGVRPSQPPLILKRIIMSEAPKFGTRQGIDVPPPFKKKGNDENDDDDEQEDTGYLWGCSPYLQIFKAGQLVLTTAAMTGKSDRGSAADDLPFIGSTEGPVSFSVESVVQGDVLLRCRHLSHDGQRVSMFRAAFHTGYVPPNVMRLTKAQLDGACNDKRFPDDFFLDLILEPCHAEEASKHLMPHDPLHPEEEDEEEDNDNSVDKYTSTQNKDNEKNSNESAATSVLVSQNEAQERRNRGTVSGQAKFVEPTGKQSSGAGPGAPPTIVASAYDSMLHRDSRFWDVIANRRMEKSKKASADAQQQQEPDGDEKEGEAKSTDSKEEKDAKTKDLSLWGPTIGRRRAYPKQLQSQGSDSTKGMGSSGVGGLTSKATASTYKAFSIGVAGESFSGAGDFFDNDAAATPEPSPVPPRKVKERDELMEALMALEDETPGSAMDDENEDDGNNDEPSIPPRTPAPTPAETSEVEGEENATSTMTAASATAAAEGQSSGSDDKLEEATKSESQAAPPESDTAGATNKESETTKTLAELDTEWTELKEDEDLDDLLAGGEDGDDDMKDLLNGDDIDDDEDLTDLESFLTAAARKD